LTAVKRLVWSDLTAIRTRLDETATAAAGAAHVEQIDLFAAPNEE